MNPRPMLTRLLLAGMLLAAAAGPVLASDHDDTPELKALPRNDARLTDLYAFTRGQDLVLVLCTDPAVPPAATSYSFAPDLTLRIEIDHHTPVRFDDPTDASVYGGTIVDPDHISADVTFEITFERGEPSLQVQGIRGHDRNDVRLFAGLRDDPFIRGPRNGRNVAAVVLELPLGAVVGDTPTLLIWGSSKVPEIRGPVADQVGRALRSQFSENLEMNTMPPRMEHRLMGVPPDVMIYDTSRPASFPNGRALTDDVVDLVGDPRVLANDTPFPSANDLPFLPGFPYLSPPHAP